MLTSIPLSEHQLAMAARTAKARKQREEREQFQADAKREFKALCSRRDRAHRSDEQKCLDLKANAKRNEKLMTKEATHRAIAFVVSTSCILPACVRAEFASAMSLRLRCQVKL